MSDFPTNPHVMLRFDWDAVRHKSLSAAIGVADLETPGQWQSIWLVLNETAVVLSIDVDTDQLSVTHQFFEPEAARTWAPIADLRFALGRPLGCCWEARNDRGYLDGFILAFGDIAPNALEPRCMFLSEASRISILMIR